MAKEDRVGVWMFRPASKAHEVPYREPPAPANPVVRGWALHLLAQLVSSSSLVQYLLWQNAGFNKLRNKPELDGVDARFEPTVIRGRYAPDASVGSYSLGNEDWHSKQSSAKRYMSILDYHEAYKQGKITPTAVAEALLPIIRRDVKNSTRHATAFLDSKVDLVLEAAEASTKRFAAGNPLGPLDGVPVAVKDEEDVAGYRKCVGSKLDFTHKDNATSYCVQQWLDAGAVLVGKTNMHELGMDTTNNNPNYGTPLNPHNDRYYCGGSSGGSAYAVNAGLVPVTIGNDGGGSIRIPSAYCGLYGLKPSHGRVSIRPSANLAKSNGVAGPIAANMIDLEIGYRVMAQPDMLDPDSKLFPPPGSGTKLLRREKKLGIYRTWFDRADPIVKQSCQKAIEYLTSKQGYTVVDITIPMIHDGQTAHAMTILCEIASGVSSVTSLTPANQALISLAHQTPAVDLLQAQKVRNLLMQHLSHLFEQHPGLIIVTPTTPNAGWSFHPRDLAYGCSDGNTQVRNMEYAWMANFVGCPAISVPIAYVEPAAGTGRVPVGLMGMGEWCSEDDLIAFGYECEGYLTEGYDGGRVRPANFVDVLALARSE